MDDEKPFFFSAKTLIITFILLFIVSLGFNVHYYNAVHFDDKNNVQMSKYYMEMHAVTFSNALASTGGQEIREYIKNADHVSNIIEGIELAEFQYLVASKYVSNEEQKKKSISILQFQSLINGYLHELRSYRAHLSSPNPDPYENMNQVYTDLDDLIKISKWFNENTEFQVYTDQDFYKEVYSDLQSDIKKNFF